MRPRRPQAWTGVEELQGGLVERSLGEGDLERLRGEGGSWSRLEGRQGVLRRPEMEGVHEGGEELEELHPREHVSQTHPSTCESNKHHIKNQSRGSKENTQLKNH